MKTVHLTLLFALAGGLPACERPEPATEEATEAQLTDAQVTEAEPGLFATAGLTADSAITLAKANTPGRIVKGELESEAGALIYSFDIAVPGQEGITEVHVDAQTGAILKVEHEEGEEGEEAGESGG